MKKNGFAPLIILIVITLILVAGYFLIPANIKDSLFSKTPLASNAPQATVLPVQESLFSGKLTKLTQDLKLFKETEEMKLNGSYAGFSYYSAGKFIKGSLAGYTRIVALSSPLGPGFTPIYILATKDFNSYILDDPENLTAIPDSDYQNPYSYLDKTKITSTAIFNSEQPKTISLDNNYSLYFDQFSTDFSESQFKDKFNQTINETILKTDYSSFKKLNSPLSYLSLYFEMPAEPINKYVLGDTKVVVVDSTGLPKVYSLTTPSDISKYQADLNKYNTDYQKYQDDVKKFQNKEISSYPNSPDYVYPPHLGFKGKDVSGVVSENFYNDYETAFPGACANSLDTRVVNVNDSDLEKVGTVKGLSVFKLQNSGNELNTLQYESKMSYYKDGGLGMTFEDVNKGMTKPTSASDYTAKNPLLFVKDPWGRWVAVGEWDIKLPGGCGKPVIYLYPTKDTKVTLKFNAPVSFTTNIPTYGDSWQVFAHKGGSLTNLIPALTDCSKFGGLTFGSEYAKNACLTNTYPYLYWSGNIASVDYPKIDQGWVVAKDDLTKFIDSKLSYMGLNANEKNDFESYWVPEMLSKNSNFYKVSFFGTHQLNQLFPMTVTPTPDSIFRIFMDWKSYDKMPAVLPVPQILEKINRNGFTMVEWGGLK